MKEDAQRSRRFKDGGNAPSWEGEPSLGQKVGEPTDNINLVILDDPGGARGKVNIREARIREARAIITLFKTADASTCMHETGHLWLEELMRDAADPAAPASLVKDAKTVRDWLGNDGGALTREQHEQFARGFERYLMEGRAPTRALAEVFAKFKQWLTTIYQRVSGLDVPINDDIRGVFDRLTAKEAEGTTVAGAVKPRIPRLSETLLPGRDFFGEPISNADAASAGARAQIEVDKMRNDPVRQAMLRLGVFPGMPERTIRGVELSDKQYDDFARISGRLMKMRLDQIVRLRGFDRLSGATQRALFDDAIAGSRDAASSLIMMQNPSIITAAIKAKLASLAAARQPTR